MKEALENYYRKLNNLYMREYQTLPTVAYSEICVRIYRYQFQMTKEKLNGS